MLHGALSTLAVLDALVFGAVALGAGAEPPVSEFDVDTCVAHLPQCLELIAGEGQDYERLALQLLQSWVQQRSQEMTVDAREGALFQIFELARFVKDRPYLALGIGQVLHSYFWWGTPGNSQIGSWPSGPSVEVLSAALSLHEFAVRYAGCDLPDTEAKIFLERKCPCRWRFVVMIGAELGLHLAVGAQNFSGASVQFHRTADAVEQLHALPFFRKRTPQGTMRLNQNWDYFPDAQHWPVWPREVWPFLGSFLEEHFATFREALDGLLEADPEEHQFAAAARFQSGLTPRNLDWARLKLVHSGGEGDLCNLPYMRASCALLSSRPEIGPRCGTFLSGASLARLLPGAQLKPHFGTHPRLTVHLTLRTSPGASMVVAGEEVVWQEGRAVVFDDTYMHKVRHLGAESRYILVAWFCHPCDLGWREGLDEAWNAANPLPAWCGSGGFGYSRPPVPGYGDSF